MNLYGLLFSKERLNFHPHIYESESTLLKINKTFYWANKELKVNCFAYAFKTIESMYCQYLEALLCYQKTNVRSVENWIFNQATDSKFDLRFKLCKLCCCFQATIITKLMMGFCFSWCLSFLYFLDFCIITVKPSEAYPWR